ncbi:MAG: DUF4097 family beta strand repeat-containing protein [Candidatus Cloacimonadales bacterium]
MKKTIFIFIMISLIFSNVWAAKLSKKLAPGEIKLSLENIEIDRLEFSKKNLVEIESAAEVKLELIGDRLLISSAEYAEIDLILPAQNSYIFQNAEQDYLHFGAEFINLTGSEGEKIRINSEGVFVEDKGSIVQVNSDGIFVEDGDEMVSITSEGIVVTGSDNDVNLTGFWGSMLGSVIKGVSSTAVSYAGKRPEKIIKDMINQEDDDFSFDFGDWQGDYISETFEKSVDYSPGMRLDLHNLNGAVAVESWDKAEIMITAEKRISQSRHNYEKKLADTQILVKVGKDCEIETKVPVRAEVTVSYQIKVPRGIEVKNLQSSNGSLQVEGTKDGNYVTSNGSIQVENISGDFALHTSNGSINAQNIDGIFSAKTSNGAITTKNCRKLRSLRSSNGSIRAEIEELANDLEITSSNGTIALQLGSIDADIEASTSNSRIVTENLNLANLERGKNYLTGRMGSGGNLLKISTSNSKITITGNKGEWK